MRLHLIFTVEVVFFCVQLVDRELRVDCRFIVIVEIVGYLC